MSPPAPGAPKFPRNNSEPDITWFDALTGVIFTPPPGSSYTKSEGRRLDTSRRPAAPRLQDAQLGDDCASPGVAGGRITAKEDRAGTPVHSDRARR
jgi:hypothetical protein